MDLQRCQEAPQAAQGTSPTELHVANGHRTAAASSALQPSFHHLRQREQIQAQMLRVIRKPFPKASLYFFGSIAQTVSTAHSDLDLCVIIGPGHDSLWEPDVDREERAAVILKVRNALRKGGLVPVFAITKSRIPLCKFEGNAHLPPCDIGLKHDGVRNSSFVRRYVEADRKLLQPLLRIVNRWTKSAGINNSSTGWFSSYALTLMVLHQLVQAGTIGYIPLDQFPRDVSAYPELPEHVEATEFCTEDYGRLGKALEEFFIFYGHHWDVRSMVVHLRPPGEQLTKVDKDWTKYAVAIEDPFELDFNPAHQVGVGRWKAASSEFRMAALRLRDPTKVATFFQFF